MKRYVSNESRVGILGESHLADFPLEAMTDGLSVLSERSRERRTVDPGRVSIGIGLSVPKIVLSNGFPSGEWFRSQIKDLSDEPQVERL